MSIESRSRQYGKVFDHWQLREFLGSGSGGKSAVFRIVHTGSASVTSAIKVVNLIEERGIFDQLPDYRKQEYLRTKSFAMTNAEREVLLMNGLQGRTNIVDYLDHTFVDWQDESGFGCDLLIRMELLQDLRSQIAGGKLFTEAEILKVGIDICNALVLCHGKNILHRDIKPGNIFFNQDGNYKLGDFGVSRILSSAPMSVASTGIGTPQYLAPEQIRGSYDKRVDIYSLGLVLYELSNRNRMPFASTGYVTEADVQRRLSAAVLPAPSHASPRLASVILKACAYDPNSRYQTAEEFLSDLNSLLAAPPQTFRQTSAQEYATLSTASGPNTGATPQYPNSGQLRYSMTAGTTGNDYGIFPGDEFRQPQSREPVKPPARSRLPLILGAAVLVVLIGVLALVLGSRGKEDSQEPAAVQTLPAGEQAYQDAVSHCQALAEQGDYVGAVSYLQDQIRSGQNGPEYQDLLEEYQQLLKQHTLETAEAYADEKQYKQAALTILQAQEVYDCEEFQVRLDMYMVYLTVPLTTCYVTQDSNDGTQQLDVDIGNWGDLFGTVHHNAIKFWVANQYGLSNSEFITFRLDKPFEKLTGQIAYSPDSRSGSSGIITIYVDDYLVYTSPVITEDAPLVEFEIDVHNADRIRVECTTDDPDFNYTIFSAMLHELG